MTLFLDSVRLEIELRLIGPDVNGYDAHTSHRVCLDLSPGTRLVRDSIQIPPVPSSSEAEAAPLPTPGAPAAVLAGADIGGIGFSPITPVGGGNVSTVKLCVL